MLEIYVEEKLQRKIISFLSMAIHHSSDKALTGTFVIQTCHSITGSFENMNKKTKTLTMGTGTCIGKKSTLDSLDREKSI